jgi:hypothetical protein
VGPCAFSHDAVAQTKDLSRAREKDKEGAKAYGEGRYADAIRFFDEAYHLGGPPFELWNIAKCHLRLDEPDRAAEMLERYLATPNVPKGDRIEVNQQLEVLKKRSSQLTVTSTPAGAVVTIDGKAADTTTPTTVTVGPGRHTVVVAPKDGPPVTKEVEARYGRPLTVDTTEATPTHAEPPPNPYVGDDAAPRFAVRVGFGISLPKLGEVGSAGPEFLLYGTYRVARLGKVGLSVGALLSLASDSWENRTGMPNNAAGCTSPVLDAQSGTAIAFYGIGSASVPITSRLTFTGSTGIGIAGYSVDNGGGDVFVPSCSASPGVKPTFMLGTELDYAVTPTFRLSAFPLTWQAQPAFDGVRATPFDASGPWLRFGIGIGAGVNL